MNILINIRFYVEIEPWRANKFWVEYVVGFNDGTKPQILYMMEWVLIYYNLIL